MPEPRPILGRQRIGSGSPYEPVIGFSRAIRVGDRVLVSGTAPVWPDGSVDPDPEIQARRCLEDPRWRVEIEAEAIITRAGAGKALSPQDVADPTR